MRRIDFLTTSVGRGHRFYLEGLRAAVQRHRPELDAGLHTAPQVSGALGTALWSLIRGLYREGSRSGVIGVAYGRLRSAGRPDHRGLLATWLGRDLIRWARRCPGAVVVDHPLLAGLLGSANPRPPLVYMHGELVAPMESLSTVADLTLVPTDAVRRSFLAAGASQHSVVATGLSNEEGLRNLAVGARAARIERAHSGQPLTGAFYSSGAEPRDHCRRIALAVSGLIQAQQRALVFARRGGRLERCIRPLTVGSPRVQLHLFDDVRDEEAQLVEHFERIDFFVAPAHERTQWALGLGLPFFMLGPNFGSYAPLNWELARAAGVARGLGSDTEARRLGETLLALRQAGALEGMNRFVPRNLDGFDASARAVCRRLAGGGHVTRRDGSDPRGVRPAG